MPEIIRNHFVKITIGTIVACLLFAINTTWKVATAKAIGDATDAAQDYRISSLETAVNDFNIEVKSINKSLAEISTVLGMSDVKKSSFNK